MTIQADVIPVRKMGPGTNVLSNSTNREDAGHMLARSDSLRLWNEMDAAMSRFLVVEAGVGRAFAKAAIDARETREALHNRQLARKAYDTIVRLMSQVRLTKADAKTLHRGLQHLKQVLSQLGDPV